MKPTILIVDDEKHTREGLRSSLEDHFDVYTAADSAGAVSVLQNDTVDLMVTDLRLGADDGMKLIDEVLRMAHPPICIMMTAYGSVDAAVEAMKRGAYDFVTKPLNIDKLEILIKRALRERTMEKENIDLKKQVNERFGLESFIGSSPVMQEVFDKIKQVAPARDGADRGRKRHGEGTGGSIDPPAQRTPRNSSPCIARRSRRSCSRASCSATSAGRSRARSSGESGASSRRTAARCSSTRSARSTRTRR